jgi:CHAD domain-containing protein
MMEIERDNAQKPIRKLRKVLKRLPDDPSTKEVHSLRTQTRRLEAIVDALMLDHKKRTRKLLKTVTPVRKVAGDVRDMDVLVGNVLSLSKDRDDDSLVRLVEHLGELRIESARGLRRTVAEKRKDARQNLKQYSKLVECQFRGKKPSVTSAAAAPAQLIAELANWPDLNVENIHPFRIKVKHLRYMLQLSPTVDAQAVEALGKVKDEVGDWHDWQELAKIAKQVLDPDKDRAALKRIEEIGNKKLKGALATANSVRNQYFSDNWKQNYKNGRKKKTRSAS